MTDISLRYHRFTFKNNINLQLNEHYSKTGVRVLTMCFGATDTALLSSEKLGSFDKDKDENIHASIKTAYRWQT